MKINFKSVTVLSILLSLGFLGESGFSMEASEEALIQKSKGPAMDSASTIYRRAFEGLLGPAVSPAQKNDLIHGTLGIKNIFSKIPLKGKTPEESLNSLRSSIPFLEDLKEPSSGTLSQHQVESLLLNYGKTDLEKPLVVIIPGIFGEFIVDHPFQDVLDEVKNHASPFAQYFHERYRLWPVKDVNKNDPRFQLKDLSSQAWSQAREKDRHQVGEQLRPLSDSVLVGALRGEKGDVLANTLTLDTMPLSLESLGDLRSNARLFNRRLSKFFNILGYVPKTILLVGYSRGTAIGLDMLALAQETDCGAQGSSQVKGLEGACVKGDNVKGETVQWTRNVRSFLAVGGVIYGSELADVAFPELGRSRQGSSSGLLSREPLDYFSAVAEIGTAAKVQGLAEVAERLSLIDDSKGQDGFWDGLFSDSSNQAIIENNNWLWSRFLSRFLEIQSRQWGEKTGGIWDDFIHGRLDNEGLNKALKDIQAELNTDLKIDVNAAIAQGILIMQRGFGEVSYNSNILQFKKLVAKTLEAAQDLTTASRISWWSQHTIPTDNIKYFSVSATMTPSDDLKTVDPRLSQLSYNFDTVDFRNLLASYKSFITLGHFFNNDSQVSLHKSTFHPSLAPSLNEKQKPFKAEPLAVFHTHHWGLALRSVTPVKSEKGQTHEPFPREALLKAALATMIQDPELNLK